MEHCHWFHYLFYLDYFRLYPNVLDTLQYEYFIKLTIIQRENLHFYIVFPLLSGKMKIVKDLKI